MPKIAAALYRNKISESTSSIEPLWKAQPLAATIGNTANPRPAPARYVTTTGSMHVRFCFNAAAPTINSRGLMRSYGTHNMCTRKTTRVGCIHRRGMGASHRLVNLVSRVKGVDEHCTISIEINKYTVINLVNLLIQS